MPARPKAITPTQQFMIICEAVAVDQDGGISLRRLFDEVMVPDVPMPIPLPMSITLQFRDGQGAHKHWLDVVAPNGDRRRGQEVEFWLASRRSAHRVDARISLQIIDAGTYWFVSHLDGREVLRLPLVVRSLKQEHELSKVDPETP